ncbi:MAG: hypothetical protein ACOX8W_06115 [bacterium]|jgi:hypothetical protein
MSETALNALAQQYLDLTLCKSRCDEADIQWYTEGPFWRRTSMRYSREYKILPDYEIGDMKHGKTLEDVLDEAGHLKAGLELYGKTAKPEEMQRVDYLIDHVENLRTRTRLLLGEKMPYDTMTDGMYGLVTPAYDHKKFDDIVSELRQELPGDGSVQDKIGEFRRRITIPREKLLKVMQDCTQAFHDMSMQRMHLTGNSMPRVRVRELPDPNMHFLSILFGYDYNHIEYERNFNLLVNWTADHVVECIGHEMEPGHLTYYEKRTQTMIDTCWPEMAVVSLYSSSSAFTEGSARYVIDLCFDLSMDKKIDFEREYIFRNAGLDLGLTRLMPLWHRYIDIAGYGKLEASRNVWDGVWSREEALAFLKKYGFADQDADVTFVDNLAADMGHFTSHDYARDVVIDYFNTVAKTVDEQWLLYERLCCAHMSMRGMQDKTYRIDS